MLIFVFDIPIKTSNAERIVKEKEDKEKAERKAWKAAKKEAEAKEKLEKENYALTKLLHVDGVGEAFSVIFNHTRHIFQILGIIFKTN